MFLFFLGDFKGSNADDTDIDDIYVDWVRVRKAASVEPTVSVGDEGLYPYSVEGGETEVIGISVNIDFGVRYEVIIVTRDGDRVIVNVVGR